MFGLPQNQICRAIELYRQHILWLDNMNMNHFPMHNAQFVADDIVVFVVVFLNTDLKNKNTTKYATLQTDHAVNVSPCLSHYL